MSTVVDERAAPPSEDARRGFRTDIQALRAVAVLAVVVNHLWPHALTGGYVGVDVFFVISGYLITSHLDREITATGRVRLGRFYARRVRRLLPAAFLVLAVSLVAAWFLLPYPRWRANATEAFAAATYWENWLLAAKSVDYSAANAAASLVQHYWSLSVEEQFYLVWPLLLVLLVKVRARRAQLVGVAVVSAASLAFSIHYTQVEPTQAYFVTPVRVWEFGLGALVALAAVRLPARLAEAASFAGLSMIVWSAFAYGHGTPFPGWHALVPTVGTALVIASEGRRWHTPVTAAAPVQFLGGISYSLYLWHWPLIVVAPFVFGVPSGKLGTPHLLGVLAVAVVLSWLSKRFVEDRGITLTRRTGVTFAGMVAGLLVVSVAAYGLNWTYARHVAQAERDIEADGGGLCHGARAMVPTNGCPDPLGPARVVDMGPANQYFGEPPGCTAPERHRVRQEDVKVCDYSGGATDPKVVWLVGDSHAQQWQPPVADLARRHGWVLKYAYLGGCPMADVAFTAYHDPVTEERKRNCLDWSARTADTITGDAPDLVLTSFFARREYVDDGSRRSATEQYRDGLEPRWRKWTDAGARVVVLGDPPFNGEARDPDCVSLNPTTPGDCAVDRATAHPEDPLAEVARTSANPAVSLVDLTDYFCDDRKCHAVIGGVAVYYDTDHLNREFSRSLTPVLDEAIGLR
ncbi:acyltransferase family protein [Saccharothrix longispora]|uniref:Peptidoglycan/LPS O-acetylase OafA/YrhL n=1 Tax=Saccharothrix longispora TaxID=33920 RepID=A0ABU1PNT1_9PSEU|nr:acyltransferase family protein [Saccharothrix longispora]MDR6592337.1 peptidoglycan/LPS O-acetylase OafA/YrhL [Saccharothrix longispora]